MTSTVALVPTLPGLPHGLGRHVNHDERSRRFVARQAATLTSVKHRHFGPVLDQGAVGSCTGHALVDCLMTAPDHKTGRTLTHADALSAYERATVIDPYPGSYPPDDTGSDGLDVCKVGVERGWISGYDWAFGRDQCLAALVHSPVMCGTVWYEHMFDPDSTGLVTVGGAVAGGHEYCLTGLDVPGRKVRAINSWGNTWGVNGSFFMSFDTLGSLLDQQGDCVVPRP